MNLLYALERLRTPFWDAVFSAVTHLGEETVFMVAAMNGDPARRRILESADGKYGESVFQPFRAGEAAVGQQPVIADIDAERSEDVDSRQTQENAAPAE